MSIHYQHSETIQATPEGVFAVIDDLALTAKWLPPCVSLEKLGPGPNAPGDRLRYVYRQGGKQGEMQGEIVARVPNQRLHYRYFDEMFDVSVDLHIAPSSEGSLTTHIIHITPRTFLGKTMQPLIQVGLKKQTRSAAANLKHLLESQKA